MPISAPPPSWASIKNKPNTVAGFGITDMGSQTVANATNATNATNASNVPWSGVSSKPTTVAGLGLSDFNTSAIAAQAGATVGAVGTYALCVDVTQATRAAGDTLAGSSLRYSGPSLDSQSASPGMYLRTASPSGTWRLMGAYQNIGSAWYSGSVWLRIA